MKDTDTPLLAITIGVELKQNDSPFTIHDSLLELKELADTAGLTVIHTFTQQRYSPARRTYVGSGKIQEIKTFLKENPVQCVLTDDEITPAQSKFLEKELAVKILDRTGLILDIFSQRAQTYEAKLQVELAQLNYLLPRLTRLWTHLSRLGGGIGTRGPGEKQLEVDKRQLSKRVSHIKSKLKKIQQDRALRRNQRQSLPVISGAIVGYTNAGKSTLMNRLTTANVLAENKLFATLDPTSRKCSHIDQCEFIVTDTVGFIQKLPTHLIKAFYSTLEEVTQADFLIHVIDASHPHVIDYINTSQRIIETLGATTKPIIYVFNKWDLVNKPNTIKTKLESYQPQIMISAKHDGSIESLLDEVRKLISTFTKTFTFFIPYNRMDIVHLLHSNGKVLNTTYEESICIEVIINEIIGEKIMSSLYSKTQN